MSTQGHIRVQNHVISSKIHQYRYYEEDTSRSNQQAPAPKPRQHQPLGTNTGFALKQDDKQQQQQQQQQRHFYNNSPEISDLDSVLQSSPDRDGSALETHPSRPVRQRTRMATGRPEAQADHASGPYRDAPVVRESPQRVRVSGRSHSAGRPAAPSASARMGRFVNAYPASRQAAGNSGSRATSPYAFHVPPSYGAARGAEHARSTACHLYGSTNATPTTANTTTTATADTFNATSRPTSPACYGPGDDTFSYHDARSALASPQASQTRYGYVRADAHDAPPPAASKFNKSLRSRTISHLPSMVQVSTLDTTAAGADNYGAADYQRRAATTSEAELLKAHKIAWRASDLGHENPFKPGTELSLEADLMVRLIKRGYPIDELPRLVEAAKSELASAGGQQSRRSKSCDRLSASSSSGYSRRTKPQQQQQQQQRRQSKPISHSQSHHEQLVSSGTATGGGGGTLPAHLHLGSSGAAQQQPAEPAPWDDAKAVWANSLKRAKSMPRFGRPGAKTPAPDADSLDKLITSIELEISDLLEKNEKSAGGQDRVAVAAAAAAKNQSEKIFEPQQQVVDCVMSKEELSAERVKKDAKLGGGAPEKRTKERKRSKEDANASPKRQMAPPGRPLKEPLASSKHLLVANELRPAGAPSGAQENRIKKKDKPRCCLIQ